MTGLETYTGTLQVTGNSVTFTDLGDGPAAYTMEMSGNTLILTTSDEDFDFGPNYIIPKPFDSRVLLYVAPAVAQAAMETGVARAPVDIREYKKRLEQTVGDIAAL